MLKSQEIQLAQSKRRERMAEIQKADEISDDGRTELRSLTDAYQNAETEYRAAVILEDAERAQIKEPDNAGREFERECRSFDLTAVVGTLVDGKPLSGREAEVNEELERRHGVGQKGVRFPWEALEQRADAVTDARAGTSGELASRPTMNALERFFESSAAGRFGVNVLQVSGAPSFPEITSGTGLSWVAEGAGADAGTITTTATSPAIKTATARYLLTRQAIRQNSALQQILRRDLSEVLREGIDLAIFRGTGADEQPAGFETVLTGGRTAALTDVASFSDFLLRATEIQETAKLSDPSQVRIAGAPIVAQTLLDTLISGTAVSEMDRLKSAGFSTLWSSQVSARGARDATDKGSSTVYFGAGSNNAYVPTWGSPELIVDPYSESKSGKVALTMFAFLDVLIQRTATHYFKLTGVQDRA
ncbi:phage major capsid protein [Sagittula sp. MA-2]|jgi:HK97 family phage major capsid protein|uniref:phage major capsid protein n=1 Tax=Sagittula sp. MA-2 TaxID=3048007 RepID=UPI0024C3BB66|nr:phage major capsid protein [Sagittula sp. MA-2]WHZ37506.1 phage major capsid protein [Sagittula sp. MA-2]